MKTTLGIIQDIHQHPERVSDIMRTFQLRMVDRVLVNGDICQSFHAFSYEDSIAQSQAYSSYILKHLGESGLECYFWAGSHESIRGFELPARAFSENYPYLTYVPQIQKFDFGSLDLIIIPGSDYVSRGGEFHLGTGNLKTGMYISENEKLSPISPKDLQTIPDEDSVFRYNNMSDLEKLVINPEKTIAICHIPPRFDFPNSVDIAHFYQLREYSFNERNEFGYIEKGIFPFEIPTEILLNIRRTDIIPKERDESFISLHAQRFMHVYSLDRWQVFVERKTNRGNSQLKDTYNSAGIQVAINGHFHESGGRAHTKEGIRIDEDKYTKNLFWNPGSLDEGKAGILTISPGIDCGISVSYESISL